MENTIMISDTDNENELSENALQLSEYYEIQSRRYEKILDCSEEVK
ncbi:MAG: hypothetical protein IIT49_00830 [Clostridia bacterium]|nr:hypothetical protein [Clostridia bacterium]MBQ2152978.1 hypothetical protein [Clostridia bacterium]MBQ2348836.1 hypothetical protein [Clostridia bacterium]MBQ5439307.1 hypothetical protein [Clostridia bacterium]